ncbi:MAG: T9SS type A sorting domain-containing protein, partial [Ignavibacteriaceae bacterium]|nr:T9SS type A sorting domain-containing protein [Ignavibacteriaceae bacterium]
AQNYPNPFNPSTNIKFSVPESGNVKLSVYNLVGEEVAVLVNGFRQAGTFEVTFDASNLSTGIYLYKLQSENSIQTKKMMLLK